MPFTPPIFNLLVDIWYDTRRPSDGDPDFENQPAQFYITPKGNPLMDPPPFTFFPPAIYLRMPFDDSFNWEHGTIFEVPAESAYYYRATFKDRMHLGFPNQYRIVLLYACDADGVAITRFVDATVSPSSHTAVGDGFVTAASTGAGTGTRSAAPVTHDAVGNAIVNFDATGTGVGTLT